MGALGKGGRFVESLPDLALGKVASPLNRFGAAPQAAQGEPFRPQPRRRRSPPCPAVRAAAAAPPEPRRRRSPASPPHPATSARARRRRPPASRPRTPTTQSFVPPPQAEERGGVARRPLPQAVLHPPPEGHRVSTLPHSSFFPKRLRRSGALFFRRGLREPPAAGV